MGCESCAAKDRLLAEQASVIERARTIIQAAERLVDADGYCGQRKRDALIACLKMAVTAYRIKIAALTAPQPAQEKPEDDRCKVCRMEWDDCGCPESDERCWPAQDQDAGREWKP